MTDDRSVGIFDSRTPTNIIIVHAPGSANEERIDSRAIVTPNTLFFEVTARVYDGDIVEVPDPRGGMLRRTVHKVEIFQSPFSDHLDHIEAHV